MAADKEDPGLNTSFKGIFQTPFGIVGAMNPEPIKGAGSETPTAKVFDYGNANSAFGDISYSKTGDGIFDGPAETLKQDVRK